MKIEKAIQNDAIDLTELTIRSKSYWKYSEEQIDKWRDDLTVSETDILEKEIYKLTIENDLIGYYSYFRVNEVDVKLDFFFIEPKCVGQGFGKVLMKNFLKRSQKSRFKRIVLNADPNAEKFYEQLGFKTIGKLETSIENRFLPIMEMKIQNNNKH